MFIRYWTMCSKSPQSMIIILGSTFNILWERSTGGERLYNHSMNTWIFTSIMNEIFMWARKMIQNAYNGLGLDLRTISYQLHVMYPRKSVLVILGSTFNILGERSTGGGRLYNHSTNTWIFTSNNEWDIHVSSKKDMESLQWPRFGFEDYLITITCFVS